MIDQLLIRHSAFVGQWRESGGSVGQYISYKLQESLLLS